MTTSAQERFGRPSRALQLSAEDAALALVYVHEKDSELIAGARKGRDEKGRAYVIEADCDQIKPDGGSRQGRLPDQGSVLLAIERGRRQEALRRSNEQDVPVVCLKS